MLIWSLVIGLGLASILAFIEESITRRERKRMRRAARLRRQEERERFWGQG
jgi:hypothetical protein